MKIIGKTASGYLVEMGQGEMKRAVGLRLRDPIPFDLTGSDASGSNDGKFRVGLELPLTDNATFVRETLGPERSVRRSIDALRSLADKIEALRFPSGEEHGTDEEAA